MHSSPLSLGQRLLHRLLHNIRRKDGKSHCSFTDLGTYLVSTRDKFETQHIKQDPVSKSLTLFLNCSFLP